MRHALVSTWNMDINPSDFARFEWNLDNTASVLSDNENGEFEADWNATEISDGVRHIAKQVFNWMNELQIFKGMEKKIKGFSVSFKGYWEHGLIGNIIDMDVTYESKASLLQDFIRMGKQKAFRDYIAEKNKSGSGFYSFVPTTIEGMIEQNDSVYMLGNMIGYMIEKKVKGMTFENNFNESEVKFEDCIACSAILDFDTSDVAIGLLKTKYFF